MPRGVKKEHLPIKICVVCDRPFNWRKKWERCWDEVTTCSKSCNRKRKEANRKMPLNKNLSGDRISDHQAPILQGSQNHDDATTKHDTIKHDSTNTKVAGMDSGTKATPEIALDHGDPCITLTSRTSGSGEEALEDDLDKMAFADNTQREGALQYGNTPSAGQMHDHTCWNHNKATNTEVTYAKTKGSERTGEGGKACDMCGDIVHFLTRCTFDSSLKWKMVCKECWKVASGGVVDGDGKHPYYRYGGVWKNRRPV